MAKKQAKDYYLIVLRGDVEAELQGPFKSAAVRDRSAQMHRIEDSGAEDGLHRLDVPRGAAVEIGDYSCIFLADDTNTPEFWESLTDKQRFSYLVNRLGLDEFDALKHAMAKTVQALPDELKRHFYR